MKRALTVIVVVIVAAFVSLYIGAWMLMGPPVIRVENHSAREIRSMQVMGNGFNERISRLGPGESVCVQPSGIPGESGLEFRADSDAVLAAIIAPGSKAERTRRAQRRRLQEDRAACVAPPTQRNHDRCPCAFDP